MAGRLRGHFGDSGLAEDAAQIAFARAAASLPVAEMPPDAVRAWLHAVAHNAAVDILRKERRLRYGYDFEAIPQEEGAHPADTLALREGLERLRAEYREVVEMRYFQGLNATEIGASLAMSPSTVRTRLSAAIGQLRQFMREEEP